MIYYDDILNVNAYLRRKIKNNMSETQKLILDFQTLENQLDKMHYDTDRLIEEMLQIAENMELDVTDMVEMAGGQPSEKIIDCAGLLVQIPNDYDFSLAFQKLCTEAHEAGFTDVHPEELLTEEEMEAAEEFSRALDIRFKMETGLTAKDWNVLIAAIMIRVVCYYVSKWFSEKELPGTIMAGNPEMSTIREARRILSENVPFDLPDNEYFTRKEIPGFHPQMGWLIGVINILTNTVTTSKLESYSVIHTGQNAPDLQIDRKVSTLLYVVYPVLRNLSANKDSLLAAVVREAAVLNMAKAPIQDIFSLLADTMAVEEHNQELLGKCQLLARSAGIDFGDIAQDMELASFINKLIAAVHAVQYDPAYDGDVRTYAVRTNKILTISNGIATMINGVPAIISEDLTKLDFSGLLNTCLSVFNSNKFWVEVKANYLVSAYKAEIDTQMEMIDKICRENK